MCLHICARFHELPGCCILYVGIVTNSIRIEAVCALYIYLCTSVCVYIYVYTICPRGHGV